VGATRIPFGSRLWVFKDDVTDVYFLQKAIPYSVLKTLDCFLLLDHRASGSLQFRDDWLLAVLLTLLSFLKYAKQIVTHYSTHTVHRRKFYLKKTFGLTGLPEAFLVCLCLRSSIFFLYFHHNVSLVLLVVLHSLLFTVLTVGLER
jgi:hypothetical protein